MRRFGGYSVVSLLSLLHRFEILPLACPTWVDPDTPVDLHTTAALTEGDDRDYQLVRPVVY